MFYTWSFVFLQDILRYNLYTALYKFKCHSITIWLTAWNDYHHKFNEHPSSHADTE